MKFEELQKGNIYVDKNGTPLKFKAMYNDQLAQFCVCEYDEEKGCCIATSEGLLLNKFEVRDLI